MNAVNDAAAVLTRTTLEAALKRQRAAYLNAPFRQICSARASRHDSAGRLGLP